MNNGSGGIVFLLGMSLLVVNATFNGQFTKLVGIISVKDFNSGVDGLHESQVTLFTILGELLLVIILSTAASKSREAASFVIVLFTALWFLWAIKNPDKLSTVVNVMQGHVLPGSKKGGN